MALRLHINVSLNRPPDRMWRRPPRRPRNNWLDSYETIPHVRLETSGDVLSTVDMVVQRRDGPSWLRELDDDDDDDSCCVPCERGASIVSPSLDRKYKRRLYKLLKDGTETKN